jgi:phage FluMu protein Com
MNLRCIYCQTPFTLSRAEMVAAIQHMTEKNMNHYDAHCPRCRRANSISRQRMELFFPNWQEAAKQAASAAEREPASASMKTVPLPKGAKAAAKITPAKKPAAKKPAAKPAAKKATAKPAAKKAPAKGKKK